MACRRRRRQQQANAEPHLYYNTANDNDRMTRGTSGDMVGTQELADARREVETASVCPEEDYEEIDEQIRTPTTQYMNTGKQRYL